MIRYCVRCVTPETRPDLHIDEEGVCNACRNYETIHDIDWQAREKELQGVLDRYRSKDGSNYDCIVPVSGGKDSHYQVIKMLECGMTPLCVNAHPDQISDLGRRNIENLKNLGVDFIEISINPKVRKAISRVGLNQVGDVSWAEHVTIFTIPVRIAVQMNIPLIIWAENSQFERGGPGASAENNVLNRRWLEEFGGLNGMRVPDLIGQEGIQAKDLIQLTYPSDAELERVGVTGIFLGYYLPWDVLQILLTAQLYGFETTPKIVEEQMVNYENLDNHINGIHEYIGFLKFGFGRSTTQASTLIRQNRITRQQGMKAVMDRDGKYPQSYLGRPLKEILRRLELTLEDFDRICNRFTNKKIFRMDNQGNLIRDAHGNLLRLNDDNE